MLQNWLKPLSAKVLATTADLQQYQLGKNIGLFAKADELPDLTYAKAVLIGIDAVAADAVRLHLYALSFPFKKFQIVDLGNVRKNHAETIIPVLQELLTGGIIPILLGGADLNLPYLLYHSYRHLDYLLNMGVVSNRIPYSAEGGWQLQANFFANRILAQPEHYLFNMSVLGYQAHFTDIKAIEFLDECNFEHLRLGKIKQSTEETEPLLRDIDTLALNIAALKAADAPASGDASPNGLAAEEICQVVRYAGLSDKLSSFGVYNYLAKADTSTQTGQLVAQIIWYFLDGVYNRKHDYPLQDQHFNQYLVAIKGEKKPLVFWKSKRSERWWLQIETARSEKQKRHFLFPCSYRDYQQASEGNLSDRILLAHHRFE
jgi:formiminoglutamase